MSDPGLMLASVADEEFANAKTTITPLSLAASTRAEIPQPWQVDVGPVEIGDRGARVVVEVRHHGYLLNVLVVAEHPRGGEHAAPAWVNIEASDENPRIVVGIDFCADDGGGGIELARAA